MCVSAVGGESLCLRVKAVLGLVVACGCGSCLQPCLGGEGREFSSVRGLSLSFAAMAVCGVSGALGGDSGLWGGGWASQV